MNNCRGFGPSLRTATGGSQGYAATTSDAVESF